MMSLHSVMHSSHTNTDGPAISLRTSCWLLPQNEQYSNLSPDFLSPEFLSSAIAIHLSCSFLPAFYTLLNTFFQHLIHQPVFHGILRAQEIIAVGVALDRFHRLPGMLCQQLIEFLFQIQNLTRMYFNIRSLAAESAHRLMDHHARIGQTETLALLARRQQERTHAGRLPDTQRADIRLDELHGIVNRHAGGYRTSRRIDVKKK